MCCCGARRSKEAVQAVQVQVERVLVSVQNFYGEEQTQERSKAGRFLQTVLASEASSARAAVAAEAATEAASSSSSSSSSSRALLGEQLNRGRQALADVERSNEALASHVQELKERVRSAERNADRLSKQLLLLGRSQDSALAAAEQQRQRDTQEQLRQLYVQYARKSAVCDTLTASMEANAGSAETAAAQNRLRLQQARQQVRLEHAAPAPSTETQTNVRLTPPVRVGTYHCSPPHLATPSLAAASSHLCANPVTSLGLDTAPAPPRRRASSLHAFYLKRAGPVQSREVPMYASNSLI